MVRRAGLTLALAAALSITAVTPAAAAPAVRLRVSGAPALINAGTIPVGESSEPVALYFTNDSRVAVKWLGAVVPYTGLAIEFTGVTPLNTCWDGTASIIQPGQTCALYVVRFSPRETGQVSASFISTFTDGGTSLEVTVTIKAKGI